MIHMTMNEALIGDRSITVHNPSFHRRVLMEILVLGAGLSTAPAFREPVAVEAGAARGAGLFSHRTKRCGQRH